MEYLFEKQDENNHTYESTDGYVMRREDGDTPNGNPMRMRWVLRDKSGKLVDFNAFRHDLAEDNNFSISCLAKQWADKKKKLDKGE